MPERSIQFNPRTVLEPTLRTARTIRLGLAVFFLLVLYEGALRKWAFPEYQQIIFVLKDGVLVGTLAVYAFERKIRLPAPLGRSALAIFFPLFIWWCALEAFNFRLPNPLLGLWGFKLHVLNISLLVLIPAAFRSFDHLYKWIWRFLMVGSPILVVGILQFNSAPTAFINTLVGGAEPETVLEFVRVTGTFSYVSAMKKFAFLATILSLMLLVGERLRVSMRLIPVYAVTVLGAVVNPMVGSKWTVFAWGITFALLVLVGRRLGTVVPEATSFWRAGLIALLIGGAVTTYAPDAVDIVQTRMTEETQNTERRLAERVVGPLKYLEDAGLFGFGVGSTYQAAYVLTEQPRERWGPKRGFEEGSERLLLELGAVGFLIQYGVYAALISLAVRILYTTSDPRRFALALAALAFILTHLTEQVAFNTTVSAFFWGLMGVLAYIAHDITVQSDR